MQPYRNSQRGLYRIATLIFWLAVSQADNLAYAQAAFIDAIKFKTPDLPSGFSLKKVGIGDQEGIVLRLSGGRAERLEAMFYFEKIESKDDKEKKSEEFVNAHLKGLVSEGLKLLGRKEVTKEMAASKEERVFDLEFEVPGGDKIYVRHCIRFGKYARNVRITATSLENLSILTKWQSKLEAE